jgi:2-polyprenyl-3-methyl-5-hydroxy-6-metoxy-1,4-benzoquinol methylase
MSRTVSTTQPPRRLGDRIEIAGDYQHRALHAGNAVQRFWHESKLQLIDALLVPGPGERVLDVGCGSGVCSGHVAASGAHVVGIDANPSALAFARRAYGSETIRFVEGYVDDLPFEGEGFDKAICLEVIEHLYREQGDALLRSIVRVLRPGGLLLLTTPNYRSLWPAIERTLDLLRLVPTLDSEQHVSRFHHRSLARLAAGAGFEPVSRRTICTIGPWIAPVSHALAAGATRMELKRFWPGGTILAHLYRKPEGSR